MHVFQSKYNENNIIAIYICLYTFTYGPAASSRQQSNVADNEKCRLSVFFAIREEKSCFGAINSKANNEKNKKQKNYTYNEKK